MPGYYLDSNAPVPNNPRTIGAAALMVRDGALPLDRRADDGVWGIIAGRVEEHETVTEAVIREVREETGLETVSVALFGIFSDPTRIIEYLDGNVYRLFTVAFRVETAEGEPVASEESLEVRYVPFGELTSLDLIPVHRPIIEAFLADPYDVVVA